MNKQKSNQQMKNIPYSNCSKAKTKKKCWKKQEKKKQPP